MPYTKRLVCLANSKKYLGRCVAGIEVQSSGLGGWVRPISARENHELSLDDRRYENGKDVQLLDLIDITFLEPRPESCQRDNHLIDDAVYWRPAGKFPAGFKRVIRRAAIQRNLYSRDLLVRSSHESAEAVQLCLKGRDGSGH